MVPNGWKQNAFGDVVKLSKSKYDPKKSVDCFPCVELEHISQNTGQIIGNIPASNLGSIKNKFKSGDVIFGKLRPYLRKYAKPDFDGVCSSEIWVFAPTKNIINPYLFQFVQTDKFITEANKSAGSKMPRSDWGVVSEMLFPLPPLPEQRKIAKILSTWDKTISTTARLIDNSKQQKKSLMQLLLTGKKRLLDDSGKPFEGEWEEVKLGNLKLDISDGNYSSKYPKQSDFLVTGIPFLRSNNLSKGTISDDDMRFISPEQHSEITKGHLKKGDILLSTRGELGNVALVPDRHIGSNINAQLVRVNTGDKLSGNFLFQLFDYLRVMGKFESLSTGTALKQLPVGKLKQLEFKLPLLLHEQQKIASVLTNADKEIELLEQQLSDLKQEKKALMQQLLTGKRRVKLDDNEVA